MFSCLHTVSWKSASTEDADMVVEEVKNQNQLSSDLILWESCEAITRQSLNLVDVQMAS